MYVKLRVDGGCGGSESGGEQRADNELITMPNRSIKF